MTDIVIKAENLGKKYTIGHQAERGGYTALCDVIVQSFFTSPEPKIARREGFPSGCLIDLGSRKETTTESSGQRPLDSKVRQGKFRVLVSPVHAKEIESISDPVERIELQTILATLGQPVTADKVKAHKRAEELVNLGFGVADAAHVGFAEQAGASFISADDRLIKKCLKHKIQVWCGNPVAFCEKEEIR